MWQINDDDITNAVTGQQRCRPLAFQQFLPHPRQLRQHKLVP